MSDAFVMMAHASGVASKLLGVALTQKHADIMLIRFTRADNFDSRGYDSLTCERMKIHEVNIRPAITRYFLWEGDKWARNKEHER